MFKLFYSDVGLLTSQYGKNAKIQILSNNVDVNRAIYENVVAQELKTHGFNLYYYNSKKYGEVDFVIEYNNKVLPIEVKSGKDYGRHSALNNILNIENYHINAAIVFNNNNIKVDGKCIYYPIYMLMFIEKNDNSPFFIETDNLQF